MEGVNLKTKQQNFPWLESFEFSYGGGIKNGKIMNFVRTIFEECHKNEVDKISKQNMKISRQIDRQTDRQTDRQNRMRCYIGAIAQSLHL